MKRKTKHRYRTLLLVVGLFFAISAAYTGFRVFGAEEPAPFSLMEESTAYALQAEKAPDSAHSKTEVYYVEDHFGTYRGTDAPLAVVNAPEKQFVDLLYNGRVVSPEVYTTYDIDDKTTIRLDPMGLRNCVCGIYCFTAEYEDGLSETIWLSIPEPETAASEPVGADQIIG
ncbi:MAG: hypothetical protein LBR14_02865 [Clostridiales Family XIII bacterium]|nr:hypothetical protein [Clostridiales Family XIII bacterium]